MRHDFVARMASAQAAAVHKRNRGGATGAHKSHTVRVSDRAPVDRAGWDYARIVATSRWAAESGDAQEQYLADVYPERYAGEWL